jgi:hypothetical protein
VDLPGTSWEPVWFPDGKRLAVQTMLKGDFDVYSKDVTSVSPATPLLVTDADDIPGTFTSDGASAIVRQSEPDGSYPIKRMSLSPPGKPEMLVPYSSDRPSLSRDGKYLAYVSDRSSAEEVYVIPLAGGDTPKRVSTRGGRAVAWAPNGRELYYARPPELVAVSLAMEGPRLVPMGERVWATVENFFSARVFLLGPDGRILVTLPTEPVTPQIRVVLGWDREIAQKLGLR